MTTTVRLTAINGRLYFPHGGGAAPTNDFKGLKGSPRLLIRSYAAGDFDTCPWPFTKPEEHAGRLQIALFDERECNPFFPSGAVIELPDGTPFPF